MQTSTYVPPASAYYLAPVAYLWMTAVLLLCAGFFVIVYRLCLTVWIRGFGHPLDLRVLALFGALSVWLAVIIPWFLSPLSPWWDWHMNFLPRDPVFNVPFVFWLLLLIWIIVGILVFIRCWKSHDMAR